MSTVRVRAVQLLPPIVAWTLGGVITYSTVKVNNHGRTFLREKRVKRHSYGVHGFLSPLMLS